MRVALTSRFSPEFRGGIESVVRELSAHIERLRPHWRVERVWAFDKKTFVSSFPLLCDIVAGLLIAYRSRGADVVLINGAEYAWPLALTAPRSTRTIIVWHGTRAFEIPLLTERMTFPIWVYWKIETWLQRLACRFKRHIAVAPSVVEELRATYGLDNGVRVIVNGGAPAAASVRGAASTRRMLWVGVHPYKKGLDIALRAFALARARLPDLELRVIGCEAPLDAQARENGVTFLGPLAPKEVREELARADVLLATTRYEACSMAVIEALASGLPVIASPTVAWMVKDAGLPVTALNPRAFADAIVQFFSSGDRPARSQAAVRRAADFDWDAAARAYCEEIECR